MSLGFHTPRDGSRSAPALSAQAQLFAALTAASPGNPVLAAYVFTPDALTLAPVTAKPTAIADSSGNFAPPLELQELAGVAEVDPVTNILHANNHWYKTAGGFDLATPKSFLACALVQDGASGPASWWPPAWVANGWDVPIGISNEGIGVPVPNNTQGTTNNASFKHDNAPSLLGQLEFGVYGYAVGKNAPTTLRAQGFTFAGPNSTNVPNGWVGDSLHMGALGTGNRDSYYLALIVLEGAFTYEQAIIFERWAKSRTTTTPAMLGANPQMFGISSWPAGPLQFIDWLGDSITAGIGTTGSQEKCMWRIYQTLGNATAFVDHGINGETLDAALAAKRVRLAMNPLNAKNICMVHLGTNSLYLLDQPANLAKLKSICLYARGLGYRVGVGNIIRRTEASAFVGVEAERVAFNALLAAQWPTFADAFVDYASAPEFAAVNDAGTAYMSDGVHPNNAGHAVLHDIALPVVTALLALPSL